MLSWILWWAALLSPPAAPHPEAVGGYAGGCLLRGEAISARGPGYELIRLRRDRRWAHPAAQAFLTRLGARRLRAHLPPILVGDISQRGGGHMPSGHRSHQIGLDLDVWFTQPAEGHRGRDSSFALMVDPRAETISKAHFTEAQVTLLRQAAEDEAVARVFVNWIIKAELCRRLTSPRDRAWLHRIRPWYGHDRHFHVRLRCPADSPDCRAQAPIPPGDGCGQEIWFSRAKVRARRARRHKAQGPPKKRRPLPKRCLRER